MALPNSVFDVIKRGDAKEVQEVIYDLVLQRSTTVFRFLNEFKSILNTAVEFGHVGIVKSLLDSGAPVNGREKGNPTMPLHVALEAGHEDIISLLLERGAKVESPNKKGHLPLHIAKNEATLKLLLGFGAKVNSTNQHVASPLHTAVLRQNIKMVQLLLQHGACIDPRNNENETPLHIAAQNTSDNLSMVKMLLDFRADVNASTHRTNSTALHIAAMNNDTKLASLLAQYRANLNETDHQERLTPLHIAVKHNSEEMIKWLVEKGADINAVSSRGATPWMFAVENDKKEVVKYFISREVEIYREKTSYKALFNYAVKPENLDIVKLIVESAAFTKDKADERKLLMRYAVYAQNAKAGDLLFASQVFKCEDWNRELEDYVKGERRDLDEPLPGIPLGVMQMVYENTNEYDIFDAIDERDMARVYRIVRSKNPALGLESYRNCKDETPLHYAIKQCDVAVFELLLDNGHDVNCMVTFSFMAPLHYAVLVEREDLVRKLLVRGAKVNCVNLNGVTPLFVAKDISMFKLLMDHGASINPSSGELITPLIKAVKMKSQEKVLLLLKHGANIHARTRNNLTCLHIAAEHHKSDLSIARILLEHGADINANSFRPHSTPLHLSLLTNNYDMINFFLERGADVNTVDLRNVTPLMTCIRKNSLGMVKLLLENGVDIFDIHFKELSEFAACKDNLLIMKMMIERGVLRSKKGDKGCLLLNKTMSCGNFMGLDLLIQSNIDVDVRDPEGNTVLHNAANMGALEMIKSLLKNGANIDALNKKNYYPVFCAIINGKVKTVKLFIEYGANVCFGEEQLKQIHETIDQNFNVYQSYEIMVEYVLKKSVLLGRCMRTPRLNQLEEKLKVEVEKMKNMLILQCGITFYDLLTIPISRLVLYLDTENVKSFLCYFDYDTHFPSYAAMMRNQLRKGKLLTEGCQLLSRTFKKFGQLPSPCLFSMFKYLDVRSLKVLNQLPSNKA